MQPVQDGPAAQLVTRQGGSGRAPQGASFRWLWRGEKAASLHAPVADPPAPSPIPPLLKWTQGPGRRVTPRA